MAVLLATLDGLVTALRDRGFTVVGPRVREGAIVFDELDDLPRGWVDEQDAGHYRLARDGDALFAYASGPSSLKRFLFPPRVRAWRATRDGELVTGEPAPRYAFVGVRACDLRAVAIQDRVFLEGRYVEPDYAARRRDACFVAVNCTRAGGTCFCVSTDSGPRLTAGYDIGLTELGDERGLLAEAGSERGAELLAELRTTPAGDRDVTDADAAVARAADAMGRTLDLDGPLPWEHPRWDAVAERCLSCGNCTLVCPTCFCSTVADTTDLAGAETERTRLWDTCFSLEHSSMHGGSVRASTRSRYRQWATHKLTTWVDQFGTSGCVGCGRCITWCPVGIDITEEAAALRA